MADPRVLCHLHRIRNFVLWFFRDYTAGKYCEQIRLEIGHRKPGRNFFFMALTLAIVSFSCTGPILGSLLVGALSNNGGAMQLTFGMAGFGLGLAMPFAIFAMFPNWLQSLPKSGGWLTSVKVVPGLHVGTLFSLRGITRYRSQSRPRML